MGILDNVSAIVPFQLTPDELAEDLELKWQWSLSVGTLSIKEPICQDL